MDIKIRDKKMMLDQKLTDINNEYRALFLELIKEKIPIGGYVRIYDNVINFYDNDGLVHINMSDINNFLDETPNLNIIKDIYIKM